MFLTNTRLDLGYHIQCLFSAKHLQQINFFKKIKASVLKQKSAFARLMKPLLPQSLSVTIGTAGCNLTSTEHQVYSTGITGWGKKDPAGNHMF